MLCYYLSVNVHCSDQCLISCSTNIVFTSVYHLANWWDILSHIQNTDPSHPLFCFSNLSPLIREESCNHCTSVLKQHADDSQGLLHWADEHERCSEEHLWTWGLVFPDWDKHLFALRAAISHQEMPKYNAANSLHLDLYHWNYILVMHYNSICL